MSIPNTPYFASTAAIFWRQTALAKGTLVVVDWTQKGDYIFYTRQTAVL